MNPHEWYLEHRTAFATRTLELADAERFADHLRQCAECRREVERIDRELAWLPMGVSPVAPRPGLERGLVRNILEGPARRRGRLLSGALAAALVLSVGGWVARGQRIAALNARVTDREARVTALEDTLSVMRTAARVLQTSIARAGREGGLVIFAEPVSHRWNVVVHGLPPAPPGRQYQFWFVCADGMVRGTPVNADPSKPVMFTTGMPATGGDVMGAALTLEPNDSTDGPPRGEMLAELML
jgi:type IV secretory pathway TrbD component